MLIEINTETMREGEARALSTFLLSLFTSTAPVATVAPPPPATAMQPAPMTPAAAADTLMASEAARVAATAPAGGPVGMETLTHNADGSAKVDKEGLPWDGRIHSSSQKLTDKGIWVSRRNLDPATKAQVRAELLSVMAAPPVPMGVAPQPPATTVPPPPPADNPAPLPPGVVTPPLTTAPPPPAAQPAAAAPTGTEAFTSLMMHYVDLQQAGVLTPDQMTGLCVQLGLTQIRDFSSRPDLIPAVRAMMPALPGQ